MTQFIIAPNYWYAWQMVPGYTGEHCVPYCSPIFVREVKPLKTGKGILHLKFINAMYAEGGQGFELDLRLLKRSENYLVAELKYSDSSMQDRCAIISHIEFEWLRQFCPELWGAKPPTDCSGAAQSSVSLYLNEIFLARAPLRGLNDG